MSLYLWHVSHSTLRTQTAQSFTISKEGKKNIHKQFFVCRYTHLAIYLFFGQNASQLPASPARPRKHTSTFIDKRDIFVCVCVSECFGVKEIKKSWYWKRFRMPGISTQVCACGFFYYCLFTLAIVWFGHSSFTISLTLSPRTGEQQQATSAT